MCISDVCVCVFLTVDSPLTLPYKGDGNSSKKSLNVTENDVSLY